MSAGPFFIIPKPMRVLLRVADLLRWAEYPNCRSMKDYANEAERFIESYNRLRRGIKNRDRVRAGP